MKLQIFTIVEFKRAPFTSENSENPKGISCGLQTLKWPVRWAHAHGINGGAPYWPQINSA